MPEDRTDPTSPWGEHAELASMLLPRAFDRMDPAHDVAHLSRVWRNASAIAATVPCDTRILLAATILHDCVNLPKDHPDRDKASSICADRASSILSDMGWPCDDREAVHHAVAAHSFSSGVVPLTTEASILRDADRLDALGYVGIARCFAVSGRMNRPLYDPADPLAERRGIDDVAWTLDHFPVKLLRLLDGFLTQEGCRMAQDRHRVLVGFYEGMLDEIGARTTQDETVASK